MYTLQSSLPPADVPTAPVKEAEDGQTVIFLKTEGKQSLANNSPVMKTLGHGSWLILLIYNPSVVLHYHFPVSQNCSATHIHTSSPKKPPEIDSVV